MIKNKWFRKLFLRRALIILALVAQIFILVDTVLDMSRYSPVVSTIHTLSSLLVAVHIASR